MISHSRHLILLIFGTGDHYFLLETFLSLDFQNIILPWFSFYFTGLSFLVSSVDPFSLESDQGTVYGRQGECDYSLFYGVTVVVLRPENGASYTLTDGSRYVVPSEDNPLLGDGHEIELTELSAVPKEQQKEAAANAKAYGNVFVIRYPMSYEVTFSNRKDTTTVSEQSLDGESMTVKLRTKDSTAGTLVPLDPDLEEFFDYMA